MRLRIADWGLRIAAIVQLMVVSLQGGIDLGWVTVNDTAYFPLSCIAADTSATEVTPDSAHVFVWYHGEGANDVSYIARNGGAGATGAWIDSTRQYNTNTYMFLDVIGNIDSNYTSGQYTGVVKLWDAGKPTPNYFSFYKVADEADDFVSRTLGFPDSTRDALSDSLRDILGDSIPSIQNLDEFAGNLAAAQFEDSVFGSGTFRSSSLVEGVFAANAINASAIKQGTFDSLKFSESYWHKLAVRSDSGSSASMPDSVTARIDSILASLGYDSPANVHNKLDNLSLSGGGSQAETLVVMNAADSALIEGASIVIRTVDQSTVKVDGLATDVNGTRILELDAAGYFLALTANNYRQLLDTLTVTPGGGTDTLWMIMFDPGSPTSPDLCRVYGWVYDISGDSLENVEVSAEIPAEFQPVNYSNIIITPFKKQTVSDSTGFWQIDLIPNSLLSPVGSEYRFVIEYPSGVVFKTQLEVPDSSSWQLK